MPKASPTSNRPASNPNSSRPLALQPALVLAMVIVAGTTAGCIAPALPPVDVSMPGWRVVETAAVWRPRTGAPELAGELLVASHPDGRRLIQFSKQSLPLVTAQVEVGAWRISSSMRRGAWGGRGQPTDRVPWFQIGQLPPLTGGSSHWQLENRPGPVWHLENPRTGEFVEGAP